MAINDINTPWEGHSGSEVEGFIKDTFGVKFGYAEYSAGKITFYDTPEKDNIISELVLSGDIYAISMSMNVGASISLLTGETEKIITFTPSTSVSHSIGGESEEFPEGYSYSVAYDTGTGFVVRDSGAIGIGETGRVDIRPRVVIGTSRIRITVTGATSNYTRSTVITCNMTNLRFEVSHNWLAPWYEGENYVINGIRLDGALTKTLHVKVGDTEVVVEGQLPKSYSASSNYWQATTTATIPSSYFPIGENDESGQRVVELWLTGTGIETEHIKFNILCVKEGDTKPLVCVNNVAEKGVNFSSNTLFNYYTLNATKVTIAPSVTADGIEYTLDPQVIANLEDRVMYVFNTRLEVDTEAETGTVDLQIFPEGIDGINTDGIVEISIPLDNSLQYNAIKEPAPTLYWTASSRSNGEISRGQIINTATNPVTTYNGTWSGMTWSSDGWTTDPDGNKALCMPAGCFASFSTLKPFALGNTIEFMFRSSVIADMDTPVMTFTATAAGAQGNVTVGCIVYPMKIRVLGSLEQKNIEQEVGLCEDAITHVTITKNDNYLESGKSIVTIYINGIPNISFSYNSSQSTFGQGYLSIGQNSTDFYLYMMRTYNAVLADSAVLVNYLNAVFDTIVNRAKVREDNDIIDAGIQYSKCRTKYNCFIIEPENEELEIPSFYNQVTVQCTVYFEYAEHHDWDVKIEHVPIDGQGTTSKKYFRWNLRGKLQNQKEKDGVITPACDWYYTNGSGTTIGTYNETKSSVSKGKKGFMDGGEAGAAGHLKIDRFTAKKNVASSQQGHKMGATDLYDELFTRLGLKDELPDNKVRVAVWQYPFLGFRKRGANYEYIGLYTIGPDKGCKVSFGYTGDDNSGDGGYDYSSCMCIEGPNHSPRGTRFLHPWVDVWYDSGDETLKFGTGQHAEEAWDDDYSADIDSDTSKPAEIQQIDDMYYAEWKPAYDLVYHCSPYIASLQEAKQQHYDILGLTQNGSYTDAQIVAAINTHLSDFQSPTIRTNGEKNDLMSYYDSNYDIWYYRNTTQQYEKLVSEDREPADGRWNIKTYLGLTGNPTTAQIVEARATKFKQEVGNYFSINQTLFHKCFCMLIGAKDNDAKNTYPFKHLKLADGGKWGWKQDDLDSIFNTDNNGMATMKYSIEQGDLSGTTEIFQGSDSAFWTLIWRNYQTSNVSTDPSLSNMMSQIMDKMKKIAEDKHLNTATDNYLHDYVYKTLKYYFFDHSALYFPIVAYQEDRTYAYLDPWRVAGTTSPNGEPYQSEYNQVAPLTQALGDRFQDERIWLERRIAYIFSKYRIGAFTGSNAGWGEMAFSLKNNFYFHLIPAIDLYPVTNKGGGTDYQAPRTNAGQEAVIHMTGDASGTGYYIKAVDWLKSLGDLSGMLLGSRTGVQDQTILFSISAKRLEELKVGDEDASNVIFNAQELKVTNAPALKVINARNVTSLNTIVDLRVCYRLREAYFDGSTAPGLLLPVGSRLTNVTFPEYLQVLFLHTLNQLTAANMVISNDAMPRIQTFYFYKSAQLNPLSILHSILSTNGNILTYVYMNWDGIINITSEQWDDLLELASDIEDEPKYKNATYDSNGVANDMFNRATVIGTIQAGIVLKEELDKLEAAFPNLVVMTDRVLDYVTFNDRHFWEECCFFWGDVELVQGKIANGVITADGNALVYSDYIFACCQEMPTRRLASGTTQPAVAATEQNFEVEVYIPTANPFSNFAGSDAVVIIEQYTMNSTVEPTPLATITKSNWESGSSNGRMTIPVTATSACKYLRVSVLANNGMMAYWTVNALGNQSVELAGNYRPLGITTNQMAVPTSLGSHFAYSRVLKDLRELSYFTRVSTLNNSEFYDARSIERVVVPPNVTNVVYRCFSQCYALYDIQVPDTVTTFGNECFRYCEALEEFTFPTSLTTVGQYSFANTGLKTIVIPEGVTQFAYMTFAYNSNLETFVVPSSVTNISNDSIRTTGLKTLIVLGTTPPAINPSSALYQTTPERIIVPSRSYNAYAVANGWKDRAAVIVPMMDGYTFDIHDGLYEYFIEPAMNARNQSWSIESNSYLSLSQLSDGTASVVATGITESTDETVDIQCTFTSYGVTITDSKTIVIEHIEYVEFEDDVLSEVCSYYYGNVRRSIKGEMIASGSIVCDGTAISTERFFACNKSAPARVMSDGSSMAIPARTCIYEVEIDFGTGFPFEQVAAASKVITITQHGVTNSNTNLVDLAVEDIVSEIYSLGGKYKAEITTTVDARFLSLKVLADSGVTASWSIKRKEGEIAYIPIGITLAQMQAVTAFTADDRVFSNISFSNFKELRYFTGVTYLPNGVFAYSKSGGTIIVPVSVTDAYGSGLYNSFYNNANIRKIIVPNGANLGNGNRQHYQGHIYIWVLSESCTQVWNIGRAEYGNDHCWRRIIIDAQTVKPIQEQSYYRKASSDYEVYVPANMVDAYKADSTWQEYFNTDKIFPIEDYPDYEHIYD